MINLAQSSNRLQRTSSVTRTDDNLDVSGSFSPLGTQDSMFFSTITPQTSVTITTINPQIPMHTNLGTYLSYNSQDYNIATILNEAILGYLEIKNIDFLIERIKQRLEKLPNEIEKILRSDGTITAYLDYIMSRVHEGIAITGGLPFRFEIDKWADIEAPDVEYLEVEVRIAVKDYDQLLRIWETLENEIYRNIPPGISQKLVLTFDML